jgi:hypothetical protein
MPKFESKRGYQFIGNDLDGTIEAIYKVKKDGRTKKIKIKKGWLFSFEEETNTWTLSISKMNASVKYLFNDSGNNDGIYIPAGRVKALSNKPANFDDITLYDDSYKIEDPNSSPLQVYEYEAGRWVLEDSDNKSFELVNMNILQEKRQKKDGIEVRQYYDSTPEDSTYIYTRILESYVDFSEPNSMNTAYEAQL